MESYQTIRRLKDRKKKKKYSYVIKIVLTCFFTQIIGSKNYFYVRTNDIETYHEYVNIWGLS